MTSRFVLHSRHFAILCTLLSLAAAVLLTGVTSKSAAATPTVVVKMWDMPPSFQPVEVTIKAGETVEWKNIGNEVHHATSDPSEAIKRGEVANPPGAEPFYSGFLRPGENFSHTFKIPGVYRYTCVVHEAKGMTGEIVVRQ